MLKVVKSPPVHRRRLLSPITLSTIHEYASLESSLGTDDPVEESQLRFELKWNRLEKRIKIYRSRLNNTEYAWKKRAAYHFALIEDAQTKIAQLKLILNGWS